MKTLNILTALSAALLMVTAIGSAHAVDDDATQTQTHDRIQIHRNLQASDADFAQSLNREQNRTMNENQNQYQYKYMTEASAEHGGVDEHSMDRYSQGSASGSMNRQSTAARSMGGGRR